MPLQKQNVSISFGGGVDTKTDPKQVLPSKLLLLENGIFGSTKSLSKRNGKENLSKLIANPPTSQGSVAKGQGLATFKDELLLLDAENLYSRNEGNAQWIHKGAFVSSYVTSKSVQRNSFKLVQQDSTSHPAGVTAYAWEEYSAGSLTGSRYSVFDDATGQAIVSNILISATAIKPKLLSIGNNIVLLYVNTLDSKLYGAIIAPTVPTVTLVPVVLTSVGGANSLNVVSPNYDASVIGGPDGTQIAIAFNTNQGGGGTTIFMTPAVSPLLVVASVNIPGQVSTVLTVFGIGGEDVMLAYWNGTDVKYRNYNSNLTTLFTSGTLETIANVAFITGVATQPDIFSAITASFYYSVSAASTYNYLTKKDTLVFETNGSITVGTPAVFLRSVCLAGKAFDYSSTDYVPVVYDSQLQPTYFIARGNGLLVGKALDGVAGGIPLRGSLGSAMLPESNLLADGVTRSLGFLVKSLLTTDSGAIFTLTGVQGVEFNFFDPAYGYLEAEIGNNKIFSGGFLQAYDGVGATELGFHVFPEGASVPNPGGAFTYQYCYVYAWTDAQGQLHRSAPSIAITQAQGNAIDGGHTVVSTIPTLRLTAKQARSPVTIETYRTVNNGVIFYLASSVSSPTLNSVTVDTVTFTDTLTDAALLGNPLLYTTGGVLENIAPNPASPIVVHRNRLFYVDSTNKLSVGYSKQVIPGLPVEFSDFLTLNIDPVGGDVTALGSLDDKLVVFKKNSIGVITGQGPDAAGGQSDFSDYLPVTSDVGCVNPRSIVQAPFGLMFDTTKGKYLLDRSLTTSYIGQDVEAYNDQTVTSAQLVASSNQIRFTLDNTDLAFDYLKQQWSVFTPAGGVDSVIHQGLFCSTTATGQVSRETTGFLDGGNFIKLKLKTAWLQFANIQGFQRIYNILVLGEYISPHRLQVSLAYDFDPTPTQVDVITPIPTIAYGEASPYGAGPYGGDFPLYQWRIQPARQKCAAIQITIEDLGSNSFGEAMSISAISLEVGIKRGLRKMPASSSFG